MSRTIHIALLLLGLGLLLRGPVLADEDSRKALKKKLADAELELEAATEEYAEIQKELEHDFKVIRGEHWVKIAPKYEFAIEQEVELLREDPEHDLVAGLDDRFFSLSIVSQVINGLLAKAIEAPVREAAKAEGEIDSATILAAGLKAVFPEESFADCMEKHFKALPHLVRIKDAKTAVKKAKLDLAALSLPTLPECDGPEGTVYVPKGRFTCGPWIGWVYDLKKNKAAKARAKAFYIQAFEVTNEQYRKFLQGLTDAELVKKYLPADFRRNSDGTIHMLKGSRRHPVTGITFTAASAYAKSIGMRLPTEEEWEYAARGADGLSYPWGDRYEKGFANSSERGFGGKRNVGSHRKDRSPFGAYDMAGNVSEITSNLTERRSAAKGKWAATDAIIWRGGNFNEDKEALQATYRWTMPVTAGTDEAVGFRCVVSEKDWKGKKK
ncbi:MAG: SUMF1/EgtB/PvdO family nonheme iron enzyme [Planctomycetota bacterium]